METPTAFDWDEAKAAANLAKHGIRFVVATEVFFDPHHVIDDTSRLEDAEDRYKAIGIVDGKLLTVVFTMRGTVCRLISARRANRKEERQYGHR
jgi:uncharacterized DUF497 family protein